MKKLLKRIIQWFLGLTAAIVLAAGVSAVLSDIPDHLQLKAPKEMILFSRDITETITEYLYASDVEVPKVEGETIAKRTKNAQFFLKETRDNEEEWKGRFYSGEPFYQDGDKWLQTETATTTPEAFQAQMKPSISERIVSLFIGEALADSDDFYAGAGDGYVSLSEAGQPSQANWDTAHDTAIGGTVDYTAAVNYYGRIDIYGIGDSITIYRGFFPIDTSGLGVNAVISAAILKLYLVDRQDDYNGSGYDYVAVVQTDQPNSAELTTADYNNCGATDNPDKGTADIDSTGLSTGAYNDFTLNATGRGWIQKTGTTMLGIREGYDIQDNFPGDPGETNKTSGIYGSFSEQTDTAQDPYLEVTYTVAVAGEAPVRNRVIIIE